MHTKQQIQLYLMQLVHSALALAKGLAGLPAASLYFDSFYDRHGRQAITFTYNHKPHIPDSGLIWISSDMVEYTVRNCSIYIDTRDKTASLCIYNTTISKKLDYTSNTLDALLCRRILTAAKQLLILTDPDKSPVTEGSVILI